MIKLRKKEKGFTLVELLIVIAIIAVLAAVVTPVALSAINDSKATAVYAEIKSIETADLTYYVQKNKPAESIGALELNGISESGESKNATYAISGDENKRVLTVTISNAKVASRVSELKEGDISEGFTVTVNGKTESETEED